MIRSLNTIITGFCRKGINTTVFMEKRNLNGTSCYASTIEALNGLQSNAEYLKNKRLENKEKPSELFNNTIGETLKFMDRIGISQETLNTLPAIHVTGTKGKGSTCAVIESILRHHGLKTGFYSSPHLVEVRERIRINGKPVDTETFTKYFWEVYNKLQAKKEHPWDLPAYFRFLTLLSFHTFLSERCDVAIVEVGIGGEYDCTNVLQRAVVCITPVAVDHTALLGGTLEKIAWHKGGIMKVGGRAWSAPQREVVSRVLGERSAERQCTLNYLDIKCDFNNYNDIINLNTQLGLRTVETWLDTYHGKNGNKLALNPTLTDHAISSCFWPGRFQILHGEDIVYYLDGAHTVESINLCTKWFQTKTASSQNEKVLIFNSTGNRDIEKFFEILSEIKFDRVFFVPNVAYESATVDNTNINYPESEQLARCSAMKGKWQSCIQSTTTEPENTEITENKGNVTNSHKSSLISSRGNCQIVSIFPTVNAALVSLGQRFNRNDCNNISNNGLNNISKVSNIDNVSNVDNVSNIDKVSTDKKVSADKNVSTVCKSSDSLKDDGKIDSQTSASKTVNKTSAGKTCDMSMLSSADKDDSTDLGDPKKYDLLVTGSLHLVGCMLSIIDPELSGNVAKVAKVVKLDSDEEFDNNSNRRKV